MPRLQWVIGQRALCGNVEIYIRPVANRWFFRIAGNQHKSTDGFVGCEVIAKRIAAGRLAPYLAWRTVCFAELEGCFLLCNEDDTGAFNWSAGPQSHHEPGSPVSTLVHGTADSLERAQRAAIGATRQVKARRTADRRQQKCL